MGYNRPTLVRLRFLTRSAGGGRELSVEICADFERQLLEDS